MATINELKIEAEELGIENIPHNIKKETLEAKIAAAKAENAGNTGNDTGTGDAGAAKKDEPKKQKVIIHSNDRENEEVEAVVGHNGKIHQIKIGAEVELTKEVLGVLRDATETRYKAILDKKGQPTGEMEEYQRKRYLIESVI